jgi:hypothetical protein
MKHNFLVQWLARTTDEWEAIVIPDHPLAEIDDDSDVMTPISSSPLNSPPSLRRKERCPNACKRKDIASQIAAEDLIPSKKVKKKKDNDQTF